MKFGSQLSWCISHNRFPQPNTFRQELPPDIIHLLSPQHTFIHCLTGKYQKLPLKNLLEAKYSWANSWFQDYLLWHPVACISHTRMCKFKYLKTWGKLRKHFSPLHAAIQKVQWAPPNSFTAFLCSSLTDQDTGSYQCLHCPGTANRSSGSQELLIHRARINKAIVWQRQFRQALQGHN